MIKFKPNIKIKFDTKNIEKQATFAMAKTLTEIAGLAKAEVRSEMEKQFDRPTPYTLNSLFVKPAKKDDLVAVLRVKDHTMAKSSGSTADVLNQQFKGGQRNYKRFEGALRRNGMLKGDMQAVPGAAAALDAFGNMKKSLIVQLMSYFKLFGEQGYKANATDESKLKRANIKYIKNKGNPKAKKDLIKIAGVVYFYSPGPGMVNGRMQHLPAGIWQKRGIQGVDLSPVVLFVKRGMYQQKIDVAAISGKVDRANRPAVYSKNFKLAMSTAR